MKTEVRLPGPPDCTTFRPGTVLSASGTVRRWSRSISAPVITVTELATWSAGVATVVGLVTSTDTVGSSTVWANTNEVPLRTQNTSVAAKTDTPCRCESDAQGNCGQAMMPAMTCLRDVRGNKSRRRRPAGEHQSKSGRSGNRPSASPPRRFARHRCGKPPRAHAPCVGRVTGAGRSPGSRVVALLHLPGEDPQWLSERNHRSQLRGQLRGCLPHAGGTLTEFPLGRRCRQRHTCTAGQSNVPGSLVNVRVFLSTLRLLGDGRRTRYCCPTGLAKMRPVRFQRGLRCDRYFRWL